MGTVANKAVSAEPQNAAIARLLEVLPEGRRLLLLDLALVVTALLMIFTEAVVFFFHIVFALGS